MSSEMDSSSRPSAAYPRRPRKSRQLMVPADTLLTFARYHPRTDTSQAPTRTTKRQATPRKREQFVQANYRFAVDPHNEDEYADCVSVPDAVIPWSSIDLVFMHHSHDCPICLHSLRCPRVTPCGHVFDFVCLLQHISHSGDVHGFAKCPLCFSRVRAEDLRACVLQDISPIEVGLSCNMRLVSRERGHMIAHAHPTKCHRRIPSGISGDVPLFSRLSFADENYLLQLTADSMQDLRQMKQEDHTLEPFVMAAMESLKKVKRMYRMRRSTSHRSESGHKYQSQSPVNGEGGAVSRRDPWYFFQDKSSRNVFLHPVNHRCIVTEIGGDFDGVATEICGEVLQIERHTMNEQLRKRYRFLEHLPLGCEFCFAELDLSHLLSENTKGVHSEELTERSFARRRKQIETAIEDKLLERKRSELLQEYFTTHAKHITKPVPVEAVDSRDAISFPALRMTNGSNAVDENGDNETNAERHIAAMTPQTVTAWGTEVSSYSSVTSNMGLFPSLRQTTTLSSSPHRSADVSLSRLEDTDSQTTSNLSPPSEVPRQLFSSALENRRGRKTHGRTTILLSNQGSPYRR